MVRARAHTVQPEGFKERQDGKGITNHVLRKIIAITEDILPREDSLQGLTAVFKYLKGYDIKRGLPSFVQLYKQIGGQWAKRTGSQRDNESTEVKVQ